MLKVTWRISRKLKTRTQLSTARPGVLWPRMKSLKGQCWDPLLSHVFRHGGMTSITREPEVAHCAFGKKHTLAGVMKYLD